MINRRWWVYPSARSMWRPLARRAEREKSTNTARVRCLDSHWQMIPTTLDGSLGQTACERVRVPVWVRAAVLTERIRAAGAPKVTSHVVFFPLLLRGRLHGDRFIFWNRTISKTLSEKRKCVSTKPYAKKSPFTRIRWKRQKTM